MQLHDLTHDHCCFRHLVLLRPLLLPTARAPHRPNSETQASADRNRFRSDRTNRSTGRPRTASPTRRREAARSAVPAVPEGSEGSEGLEDSEASVPVGLGIQTEGLRESYPTRKDLDREAYLYREEVGKSEVGDECMYEKKGKGEGRQKEFG